MTLGCKVRRRGRKVHLINSIFTLFCSFSARKQACSERVRKKCKSEGAARWPNATDEQISYIIAGSRTQFKSHCYQSNLVVWRREGTADAHLTADHNVGDFGFAVTAVRLVIARADRQDEVAGVTLALSHQEAAVLALLRQQLLSLPARQVSVEPSGEKKRCFFVFVFFLIPTIRRDTGRSVELKTSKEFCLISFGAMPANGFLSLNITG